MNHNLADILALGLSELPVEPTNDLPGPAYMRRLRAHGAFRLTDGLWHYFRYLDADKALQADLDFDRPMMPKADATPYNWTPPQQEERRRTERIEALKQATKAK